MLILAPTGPEDNPPPARKPRGRPPKIEGSEEPVSPATRELQRKFGVDLREARVAAGLPQQEVAQVLGTSYQNVSKAELGRSNLTIDVMQRLAVAVRCSLVLHLNPDGAAQAVELKRSLEKPET